MKAERYVAMVHRSISDIAKIFRDGKDVSVGRLKDRIQYVHCNLRSEDGVFQRYLTIVFYDPTYRETFTIYAHVDGGELTKSIRVSIVDRGVKSVSLYKQPDQIYRNEKAGISISEATLVQLIQHILLHDKEYQIERESREEVFL